MARGCALGKANEASGLGESRYTICRVNAHAEKAAGCGTRLGQLAAGVVTVHRTRTTYPVSRRAMSQDAGYLYILRTDVARTPATAAYRVTFSRKATGMCTFTVRTASVAFSRTLTSLRGTLNRPSAYSAI